jgi:excisionase family DNA binding protein
VGNLGRKMNDSQPKGTVSVSEILAYLDQDRYLSKKDATKYLALSVRTLEKMLPEIPHFRVGKKVLFKKSELEKWMEQHRDRPQELDLDAIMESALRHVLGEEEYAKRRRRKRS